MLAGIDLSMKRWDWDFFLDERKKVLAQWPTGDALKSETAIEDAIAYHKEQPWYKYGSLRNERAAEEDRIQITP